MKKQLMINDIVCDNEGRTGRVIELDEENFIIRADGEEYHGESTKPVLLTEEWEKKATEICKPYNISLDWTRTHRLKLSVLNEKPSLGITYYYPKPQYVYELQHILRYFNIEI